MVINTGDNLSHTQSKFKLTSRGIFLRGQPGQEEILLCQNVEHGYFVLPGGCIDHSEGAAQTLVREFKEEFGANIKVEKFVCVLEQVFKRKDALVHDYSFIFKVNLADQKEAFIQQEPHIRPVFVRLYELEKVDFKPKNLVQILLDRISGLEINYQINQFVSIIK